MIPITILEAMNQMKEIIPSDHPKYKMLIIADNVIHTAYELVEAIKAAHQPKRIFRKRDRTPGNRRRKTAAKERPARILYMGAIEHMKIAATPTPTYPKGSPGGLPFVGEPGPEVFIAPDQNRES